MKCHFLPYLLNSTLETELASIRVVLQTRNTFHLQSLPVIESVWPPETMCRIFFSAVTWAIAAAMPELTSPIMKLTWSRSISLRAFCTPVPTSLAESSTSNSTWRPRMPPLAFICSTASLAPITSLPAGAA